MSILRPLKVSLLMDGFDHHLHRPVLEKVLLKEILSSATFENEMLAFAGRHLEKAAKVLAICLLRQEFYSEVLHFFSSPRLKEKNERLIIETTRVLLHSSSSELNIAKNRFLQAFFKQHTSRISLFMGFSSLDEDTATMISDWKSDVIKSRGKLSSHKLDSLWHLLSHAENDTEFSLVYEAGKDIVKNINFRSFKDEKSHDVLLRLYALYGRSFPKIKSEQVIDRSGSPLLLGKSFDLGEAGRLYYVTSQGKEKHVSRLGFGSYCVVRLGVLVDRKGKETLVAVKKYEGYFKRNLEGTLSRSRKLEEEYTILKLLNKKGIPGIPKVYYYGIDNDGKYHTHAPHERHRSREGKLGNTKEFYVMELLSDSMEKKMERRMTFKSKCDAAFSLLATLKGLRDSKIVHLDFKFSNILSSGRKEWKLSDFGISKCEGSKIPERSISGSGGFFAPEQRGFSSDSTAIFSSKIDLYSYGMMLAYMFLDYPSSVPDKDIPGLQALLYSENVETLLAREIFIRKGVPVDPELSASSQESNFRGFKELILTMTETQQKDRNITYEQVERVLKRTLLPLLGNS